MTFEMHNGRFLPYQRPSSEPLKLSTVPRLASWERSDSNEQRRLHAYLDEMMIVFAAAAADLEGPLAVELAVGLPDSADVLVHRDLDNFLEPLARRFPGDVASWWATKRHAPRSRLALDTATPCAPGGMAGWQFTHARTSESSGSAAWKQDVNEQVRSAASELPEGAVELQVVFRVGPGRNWVNLWKPALDALDPILGRTDPGRPFHPRDDRITLLGLHRAIDPALGHEVELGIWWRLAVAQPPVRHDERAPLAALDPPDTTLDVGRVARAGDALPTRLTSIEAFRDAVRRRGVIVNKDVATGTKIHHPGCRWIREESFNTKVIHGGGRNGSYWWAHDVSTAEHRFPRAQLCRVCYQ